MSHVSTFTVQGTHLDPWLANQLEGSYRSHEVRYDEESMIRKKFAVPVTVVQDDDVRRCQVDTQTTSTSGEQEDELLASGLVVIVNSGDTIFVTRASVDATVA